MSIHLRKTNPESDFERFMSAFLRHEDFTTKPHQVIRIAGIIGRLEPLTETQQKMVTAAISLIHATGTVEQDKTSYAMEFSAFLQACSFDSDNQYESLINEIEKLLKKGIWLYDEAKRILARTTWFETIEFIGGEIVFHFSEKALPLIHKFAPENTEYNLVKGIQYKGKHTLAVFNVIWPRCNKGVTECTITALMQQLALEHTRYSYGQLKLRVLEPSFEEIYAWDAAIFILFGPTFSGRRVEGVWFEVITGDEARRLRALEPEFKVALPEQKPVI